MIEDFFSDESIFEQSVAKIKGNGRTTNGISLMMVVPQGCSGVEVLLEYEEPKAALAELEADRAACPSFYGEGK